ncbi:MAG TPA: sugar-transfer associated ATP-grasp domain-containing protein [Burkholderiaceae bacterium]|nr:sugar-transfer associated ATP-grasp domain-containing protein [Burkholderiaceae bacterium]
MSGVLRKLAPESIRLLRAIFAYRTSPVAAFGRYWELYRHRSFAPDEIHFFQLLDPRLTSEDLARVVSKEELLQLQLRLNAPSLHNLTEDKLRFHAHCIEQGLPVPRIFALFDLQGAAEPSVETIDDPVALDRFLARIQADALIFKPVNGVNGEGVTRLQRSSGQWRDTEGRTVDGKTLASSVASSGYQRWMFQELVHGHPELCALSKTTGLQTVRVITAVEPDNEVKILAMRLRLICSDVAFDNFNYGTTGNVIANVDVDSGEIFSVVSNDHGVLRYIESHPRTGVRLLGYKVPQWNSVKSLAKRAALAFVPLKTVGWDIAIALPEPTLIEGNVTWGILSGEPRLGEIYRYLQTLQR